MRTLNLFDRFKKPEERQVLHSIMQVLLPQLYARFTSLMEDVSQPSVAIQKEILKIFFALIQVRLDSFSLLLLIIYMKIFLHFDWLRAVQFFSKTVQKRGYKLSAKRRNKPSILIGQWSKKLTDGQSNLLFSNQSHALDGAIDGVIFPWLRFFCFTISKFFHV